jgi:phosphoribosylamine-glycine ligase
VAAALGVDLVVVGPEAPLVAGMADAVRARGIACFGPSAQAARLEGSKAFAKEVMAAADVPTALAHVCTTVEEVANALDAFGVPYVVKDDGLAAGKGVVVTKSRSRALAHAVQCLAKKDGRIVVEEFLDGPEVSLFCITDGTTVVPAGPSAGLQARSGQRRRPQHRWHGRVLTVGLGSCLVGPGRGRPDRATGRGRDAPSGARLSSACCTSGWR